MAARDKWSVALKCPRCGKIGEVSFSEEDHPYVRRDTLRIEAITPGFNVRAFGGLAIGLCADGTHFPGPGFAR